MACKFHFGDEPICGVDGGECFHSTEDCARAKVRIYPWDHVTWEPVVEGAYRIPFAYAHWEADDLMGGDLVWATGPKPLRHGDKVILVVGDGTEVEGVAIERNLMLLIVLPGSEGEKDAAEESPYTGRGPNTREEAGLNEY